MKCSKVKIIGLLCLVTAGTILVCSSPVFARRVKENLQGDKISYLQNLSEQYLNIRANCSMFGFSEDKIVEAAATNILFEYRKAVVEGRDFVLFLSGGSSLRQLEILKEQRFKDAIDWKRVHIFFADERMGIGLNDEENNARQAYEALLSALVQEGLLPQENIHRIDTTKDAASEAERYQHELEEILAGGARVCLVLGLGPDGHIASIFSDFPWDDMGKDYFMAVSGETQPNKLDRITVTPYFLSHYADSIMTIVTGESKQHIMFGVLADLKEGNSSYPIVKTFLPSTKEILILCGQEVLGSVPASQNNLDIQICDRSYMFRMLQPSQFFDDKMAEDLAWRKLLEKTLDDKSIQQILDKIRTEASCYRIYFIQGDIFRVARTDVSKEAARIMMEQYGIDVSNEPAVVVSVPYLPSRSDRDLVLTGTRHELWHVWEEFADSDNYGKIEALQEEVNSSPDFSDVEKTYLMQFLNSLADARLSVLQIQQGALDVARQEMQFVTERLQKPIVDIKGLEGRFDLRFILDYILILPRNELKSPVFHGRYDKEVTRAWDTFFKHYGRYISRSEIQGLIDGKISQIMAYLGGINYPQSLLDLRNIIFEGRAQ